MNFIKQNKKWVLIGAWIVFVLIVAVVIFLLNNQSNDEKNVDNPPIATELGDASIDPENIDEKEEGKSIDSNKLNTIQGKSNGIDVSKWQGKINWSKVKNSHIDFAFIRIGYRGENGVIYKDDNADYNIQQAQKAGVLVGVYFYSTATSQKEAIEEANWTLRNIEGYSISYPVVYDCEGYQNEGSRTYKLSAKERTKNAVAFLDTIAKAGYDTMFYTSLGDMNTHWNMSDIKGKYKIWIAQYSSEIYPQKQKPDYADCHAWQYTNKGQVNGIEGNVDMVVCYFVCEKAEPKNTNASLPKTSAPLTDEEKIYSSVNETVTAKSETNLRTLATTKSDIVTTLKNGETVTRVGIGQNGWSKLKYKNKTVYAISSYLTTDLTVKKPVEEDIVSGQKFEPQNDKVTAKDQVNLRTLPTTDSQIVGTLNSGEFLKRSAVSEKGWSRLEYNGKVVYAISSYLSLEVVAKPKPSEPQQSEPAKSDGFTEVNEQVTAKSETNLRDQPSLENTQVIHTLKNGEYVKRIGVHSNGWSKLEYNGQTVYAISSYLTN